jgi:putative membrane protein
MNTPEQEIFALERPHPRLLWYYITRSVFSIVGILLMPLFIFRYMTLRYRFDAEGIHMSWGLLFRHQINLTYARIQDIHITSGLLQRWFGLADVKIQTASGSANAEMTIEGMLEYEKIRDFLYTRMRGYRAPAIGIVPPIVTAASTSPTPAGAVTGVVDSDNAPLEMLTQAVAELRAARIALEKLSGQSGAGGQPHV